MEPGDAIQLIILVILLLLSAFFSSAETALTTVNKIKIQSFAEQGDKQAILLLRIIDHSPKMLSTVLIGNNIVNIYASSLVTTLCYRLFGNAFISLFTGILTLFILIFGEITPKTLATIHSEKLALTYAGPIHLLMILFTPVVFLIQNLSFLVLRLMRVDPHAKGSSMTEHELRTIVNVSQEDGVIEHEEKQMIYNVFDFGDSVAKNVMIPRIDMTFVDIDSTYDELLAVFQEDKHTRFPVYKDSTDNVVGIINMKDLLLIPREEPFSIQNILREPYFTYEHKNTASLLIEMREASYNLAIVLDEYGATAGLVTLEDLLEEIVGEIRDEYDDEEEEDIVVLVPDKEFKVLGSTKLDDLNEELHLELESEDYDSIGGYIIEHLDSLPVRGQSLTLKDGTRLVVDVVEKNRIELVHIYLTPPSQEE